MLKYFFAFIMLIHGLIHCMGFAKAFGYGNITAITKAISKSWGAFWLITAVLFTITAILWVLKKENWAIIAIAAVVLSQIVIIASWKDAKYGTIANLIILLVAIPALANMYFNNMVNKEVKTVFARIPHSDNTVITASMLTGLPPVIQKWLTHSGVIGKQKTNTVRLKQKGTLKLKPDGKWMPFEASQYFTIEAPAFVWKVEVAMMPLITLYGRDKLEEGQGELLIKALSVFTVAQDGNNDKVNSASLIRFLSETSFFPTAALSNYIKWEAIDSLSAKATMTCNHYTVSGIFTFTEAGDLVSFSANRYYGSNEKAGVEKWLVTVTGYANFNGIRIPYKNKVTWQLKTGDFTWAAIELTALEYNIPEVYP
ncbi:DUF6544 family protein [Ferruginibacter sp. SUN106]|uniref:DUF6544 family protein n=1 Tax=Ferruginibacter sp. SUN106 TaxID=2978348 RepID=UPI003D364E17